MDIRVMSFNIRNSGANDGENAWPKRRELALEIINDFDPDLIGFQEVLADQHDDIASSLNGYLFAGVARDDGQRKGEWALIAHRSDRFQRVDSGNFWLSEEPGVPRKGWDAAHVRICSWVKLHDTITKRSLLFANTHWDNEGTVARHESAALIKRAVSRLAENMPSIVTGDFNSCETDEWVRNLLQPDAGRLQLIDSYRDVHPRRSPHERTCHDFTGSLEGMRIDYILHSPELKAVQAEILRTRGANGRCPSDHCPVTALIKWNDVLASATLRS